MNKNLEKQMKWIMNNLDMVKIIGDEYEYGNSIKEIVENHDNEFDRHKVYAALDYLKIPRRGKNVDWDTRFTDQVNTIKRNK